MHGTDHQVVDLDQRNLLVPAPAWGEAEPAAEIPIVLALEYELIVQQDVMPLASHAKDKPVPLGVDGRNGGLGLVQSRFAGTLSAQLNPPQTTTDIPPPPGTEYPRQFGRIGFVGDAWRPNANVRGAVSVTGF